jgi:hypothetical protein
MTGDQELAEAREENRRIRVAEAEHGVEQRLRGKDLAHVNRDGHEVSRV